MYGRSIGSLNIYIRDITGNKRSVLVLRLFPLASALRLIKPYYPKTFEHCDWMKILAASLRVGSCNNWKRAFIIREIKLQDDVKMPSKLRGRSIHGQSTPLFTSSLTFAS